MDKKYLYSRKHNGEVYKFFLNKIRYFHTSETAYYITVETPENCFGYHDTVFLNKNEAGVYVGAYTLYRYLPPWILGRLFDQMVTATAKYCATEEEGEKNYENI